MKLGVREERLFEGQTQRSKVCNEKGFREVAHDDVNSNTVVEDELQCRALVITETILPTLVNSTAHQVAYLLFWEYLMKRRITNFCK